MKDRMREGWVFFFIPSCTSICLSCLKVLWILSPLFNFSYMVSLVSLDVATKLEGEEKEGEGKRLREKGKFCLLEVPLVFLLNASTSLRCFYCLFYFLIPSLASFFMLKNLMLG